MKKRVVVLGSTGSIGQQTLDVIRASPDAFTVVGLASGRDVRTLAAQIAEFKPQAAYCVDGSVARHVGATTRVFSGDDGINAACRSGRGRHYGRGHAGDGRRACDHGCA